MLLCQAKNIIKRYQNNKNRKLELILIIRWTIISAYIFALKVVGKHLVCRFLTLDDLDRLWRPFQIDFLDNFKKVSLVHIFCTHLH